MNTQSRSHTISELVPGALIIRNAVPTTKTRLLRQKIDNGIIKASNKSKLDIDSVDQLCSTWDDESTFIKETSDQIENSLLAAVATTPLLGTGTYNKLQSSVFVGNHIRGDSTHAHQDISYRWNRPNSRYAITTWLALDQCDDFSGALQFSRGSSDNIEVRQDFLAKDFVDQANTTAWNKYRVPAPVQAGDIVVFKSNVWHASTGFQQPGRRLALAIRWQSTSGYEQHLTIPHPTIDNNIFGIDTAGIVLKNAIVNAYPGCPDSSLRDCVTWLLEKQSTLTADLGTSAVSGLRQLSQAQQLADAYAARPSAMVWQQVRDVVIPALQHSTMEG